MHSCGASLAQSKREKEELSISLQERSLQLAELQREAADKKRALDSECEKFSREKHKRQRIEEDNKVLQLNFPLASEFIKYPFSQLASVLASHRMTACSACKQWSHDESSHPTKSCQLCSTGNAEQAGADSSKQVKRWPESSS